MDCQLVTAVLKKSKAILPNISAERDFLPVTAVDKIDFSPSFTTVCSLFYGTTVSVVSKSNKESKKNENWYQIWWRRRRIYKTSRILDNDLFNKKRKTQIPNKQNYCKILYTWSKGFFSSWFKVVKPSRHVLRL